MVDTHAIPVDEFIESYVCSIDPNIPKYFPLDACRGDKDLPINYHKTTYQTKGGPVMTNYLVAYATQKDYKAVAESRQERG